VSEAESGSPHSPAIPIDPTRKNPAYPVRAHVNERNQWRAAVESCEGKVVAYGQKLSVVSAGSPDRPRYERLFAQLLGAHDQIADAARRLPGEVGDLYHEDKHRLEEALAAIERIEARWAQA
jgi:hypothetical protein